MKNSNGLEIWEIKSTNDRCKYLIDGRCYKNYEIDNNKWCRKEICEIKI